MSDSQAFELPRVQKRNLSQEVYDILRSAILTEEIEPGTRLLEVELATRLGVSRAPVREAIRQLEQVGLVESFPRRGATVVSLPEDEIDAFYEVRAVIEATGFARASARITESELDELSSILDDLYRAYELADVEAVAEADLQFHGRVLEISGLTLLRRAWASLAGPLRLRIYQLVESAAVPQSAFVESSTYPHTLLLDALRRRDAESAAEAARGHVLEVRELVASIRASAKEPARA